MALTQTMETEWSEFLLTISGCSAAGSALGLGAPTEIRTVRAERQKAPETLEKPAFADPLCFPLTTCPTIDRQNSEKQAKKSQKNRRISGCSPVGRARHLGCRSREFESPHSDQNAVESDLNGDFPCLCGGDFERGDGSFHGDAPVFSMRILLSKIFRDTFNLRK